MPKSEDDQKTNTPGGQPSQEGSETSAKLGKGAANEPADNKAAPSGQTTPTNTPQNSAASDAISLLKQDHRKVDGLFEAFEKATDDGQKDQLIQQICQELIIHTTLEEKIFYPASRKDSTEDQLEEAQVEHDSAKFLILELLNGDKGDEYRDAKVTVLAEQIRHHVKEEEAPDGLFAKAQKAGVNTRELAERLTQLKQQLLGKAQQHRLPEPEPRSYRQFSHHPFSQASQQEERMPRQSNTRDRDDYGRFTSDEDGHRGYSSRGGGQSSRGNGDQDRDDYGRFTSDHDDNRGRDYGSRSGGGERGRSSGYGDSQGHSEASGRGWEDRSGGGSRSQSYRDHDDDDRRYASQGRGQGGWFGDPEGHSEASRRGWEERNGGGARSQPYRDHDDHDRRYASQGRGQGGWFGDPEGHSEASRRGWEERNDGGPRSRSYRDHDQDDHRSASRGRNQGGWFGDSEGHSEASRRGWENRR